MLAMNRRDFIRTTINTCKSMAFLGLMPDLALSARNDMPKLHYKPLNGKSLRKIACQKIHHGSDGYVNPLGPARPGRFWQVLSWKLLHSNRFKPYFAEERVVPVTIDWEPVRRHHGLSITYLKHATVMIKDADRYIIVDPLFSNIFKFIKDFTPLSGDLREMPRPHHVLITHGHYDHLDIPSLASLNHKTHVVTPLGYNDVFDNLGMKNRTQLDWYQTYRSDRFEISLLPGNHWTMRNPIAGPNRSLWGSYLIRTASGYTIYVSGDTAYFDGFEQLGREFDIDLAIFNLGAYEPRWFMAPSHMNPAECVQAFKELNAKQLMIVHWGTFRLGDEPVYFPPIQIRQVLKSQGLLERWADLRQGQTLFLDSRFPNGLT